MGHPFVQRSVCMDSGQRLAETTERLPIDEASAGMLHLSNLIIFFLISSEGRR